MAKSQKSNLQMQFVESWMATRPYEQASEYDVEYLVVGHAVLDTLLAFDYYFSSFGVQKSQLVRLSTTLVAYFEDFINETGFFSAYVRHNHEVLGSYLPFFKQLDHYDPDYLNPEDLSFLSWLWLMQEFEGKKMFAPTAEVLLQIGEAVFGLLEEFLEDMPATDAYDGLLEMSDEDSFFKTRKVMEWVSSKHYLFGQLGFGPGFSAAIKEQLAEFSNEELQENGFHIVYDIRIGQFFESRCGMGGLTPCEWTARILRCSDTIKSKLNAIRPRLSGVFVYMGQDQRNYFFHHHPTGRKLDVAIESLDVDSKTGDLWFLSLIRWGDVYWCQGTSKSGIPFSAVDQQSQKIIPELLLTPGEHARWLASAALHERKFMDVIGTHVGIFPTATAAYAAIDKVYRAIMDEVAGTTAESLPPMRLQGFPDKQPLALAFVPGQGIVLCPSTPRVVEFLLAPQSSSLDAGTVTSSLFGFIHPFIVEYILKNYPTESLGWPGIDIDAVREAKFLSTYFNPDEAGPRVPLIAFVDRG